MIKVQDASVAIGCMLDLPQANDERKNLSLRSSVWGMRWAAGFPPETDEERAAHESFDKFASVGASVRKRIARDN